ncbi:MAG: PIN domain-containing protein [Chloroflexi bacterium]|nr:PIN domain-containing protein [Chloroflexota bacterium]MBU1748834.1 PIN domain-containing protein [Chloroflexota bacterium]
MYTVDASVHISALNPTEADSAASQAFLARVRQHHLPLFCPTLLLVEVAAALARVFDDADRARALVVVLRDLPDQTLVPLDAALADRAAELAATARLRGADAVYAAVAQHYGATLVTLDRQQLERLPPLVPAVSPADVLAGMAEEA